MKNIIVILFLVGSLTIYSQNFSFGNYHSENFFWSIKNITSLKTGYDLQSSASPQQVWLDVNNPDYIHAVFTNSQVCDNVWQDRTTIYFGSVNGGNSWFNLGKVPVNNGTSGRSGFSCVGGNSNGRAVIANHNNSEFTTTHSKIFIDSSPFEYNFITYDPGVPSSSSTNYPRIAVFPNSDVLMASSGNGLYLNKLSSGVFTGWQLLNGVGNLPETYSLAVSESGNKVGLVCLGEILSGQGNWVLYVESTDGGLTWSLPTTVWQAYTDPGSGNILGCFRGVNLNFTGEVPCVVFEVGWNTDTGYYPGLPSEIRFWSPNINGGNSKVLADSNNVPFYPNLGVTDQQFPLSRPVIGRAQINNYLFVAFNATTGNYWPGTSQQDSTAFMRGMFTYSTDGGNVWSMPEQFTPDSPLLDWRYVSIVPVSPVSNDIIKLHLVMQGDPIPGSTVNGWGIMPPSISAQYYHFSTEILVGGNPNILVTSPNGGENWAVGSNHTINWLSNNVAAIKIEYTTDEGNSWITIVDSIQNEGSYNWTVPNTPSYNCKIKITNVTNPSVFDLSNTVFQILQPTIRVIIPNGGENWIAGHDYYVTWNSLNISNVNIEYSTNSGASWLTVVPYLGSSGNYSWKIPNAPSNNCRIKISDVANTSVYDLSDNDFSIIQPSITITSPNGGEYWFMGDSVQIDWISMGVTNVKIEVSLSDGIDWIILAESVQNTGSFNWIVQAPYVSWNCLMKISDANDINIFDVSDSNFVIDTFPTVRDSTNNNFLTEFNLDQNYPNPFNPNTKIKYTVANLSQAKVNVYDVLGNEIVVLVNEEKKPGIYEVEFNGRNLPSGIYFYKMQAGSFVETKKMILLK